MAEDVTLIRCPKCHSETWRDIPNTTDNVKTKFSCVRCNYTVTIGACSKCKARDWSLVSGIDPKGPRKPVYRLRCGGCKRLIGVVIDMVDLR